MKTKPRGVGSSEQNGINNSHRLQDNFISERIENRYARINIQGDSKNRRFKR